MNFVTHGLLASLLVSPIATTEERIVVGIVGAMPDIIGEAQKWEWNKHKPARFTRFAGRWEWYRAAHFNARTATEQRLEADYLAIILMAIIVPSAIYSSGILHILATIAILIGAYALHLVIDRYWHTPEGGWYKWGTPVDIGLMILFLVGNIFIGRM